MDGTSVDPNVGNFNCASFDPLQKTKWDFEYYQFIKNDILKKIQVLENKVFDQQAPWSGEVEDN